MSTKQTAQREIIYEPLPTVDADRMMVLRLLYEVIHAIRSEASQANLPVII